MGEDGGEACRDSINGFGGMIGFLLPCFQTWKADYVRPEATYEIRLVPKAKRPLQVWRNGKKLDETLLPSYMPWKLAIADVDGDQLPEIVVGVIRKTQYTPVEHKCIFVSRFDGRNLKRKWMGSS